jgi:hypothetical protein
VTSSGEPVSVYVARVSSAGESPPDEAYSKVGRTPVEFQLPPGTYRIDVQGVRSSHESLLFEMRSESRKLLVRTGNEGMGVTGTLLTAIGVLGVVAATVILVSGTKQEGDFNKGAVVIPMYIAGGVLLGAGIGLTIASHTNIDDQKPPQPSPKSARLGFGFVF